MESELDLEQWHLRYRQQASWSSSVRNYILKEINLSNLHSILEVGCGTGAVLQESPDQINSSCQIIGIDIDLPRVQIAQNKVPRMGAVCGDVYQLPFRDDSIDFVFCHYLLLWLEHPVVALREVLRVVKPDGWVAAFAEPDHAARMDWPATFINIGSHQTEALVQQGVDPMMGRKLAGYFTDAGIELHQAGIMGGQWKPQKSESTDTLEWDVLQSDLHLTDGKREELQAIDIEQRSKASRVEFVPTFFAYGKKPASHYD